MITTDQAYERIRDLSEGEVRELVRRRLLGEDTLPVGGGYDFEPSEDLVTQLLRREDLLSRVREAVVAGCRDAYAGVLRWLASPDAVRDTTNWVDAGVRVSNVVDIAAPSALRGHAYSVLEQALESLTMCPELRAAAVRAVMGYVHPGDEHHASLWQRFLEHRDVAAYGFNALLTIDPHALRIERALEFLWKKQVEDDWPVDTAFLMRRAARARGSGEIITWVLSSLQRQPCWNQVAAEIGKRSWAKSWLELDDRFAAEPFGEIRRQTNDESVYPPASSSRVGMEHSLWRYYFCRSENQRVSPAA